MSAFVSIHRRHTVIAPLRSPSVRVTESMLTVAEKACSPLNLPWPQSEDMATALEITDMIRAKTVPPKLAMQTLKRRVGSKNGRVQMYGLGVSIERFPERTRC